MRLFTAIDLSAEVRDNLTRLIDRLRPLARVKWSDPHNLHITTKFIGAWPDERLAELNETLAALGARSPMRIRIRGLGWFPNPHSPKVFWAGVEAPLGLAELARDTEQSLEKLGVPAEKRPYSPHLTLARIKDSVLLESLHRSIAQMPAGAMGAFEADRFCLYRSDQAGGSSVYTKLADFPFSL